jgi:uncharacterized protein (UPF0276 family)
MVICVSTIGPLVIEVHRQARSDTVWDLLRVGSCVSNDEVHTTLEVQVLLPDPKEDRRAELALEFHVMPWLRH